MGYLVILSESYNTLTFVCLNIYNLSIPVWECVVNKGSETLQHDVFVDRQQLPTEEESHSETTHNNWTRRAFKQAEGGLWRHDDWVQSYLRVWWWDLHYSGFEGYSTGSSTTCEVSAILLCLISFHTISLQLFYLHCYAWLMLKAKGKSSINWRLCLSVCSSVCFSNIDVESIH